MRFQIRVLMMAAVLAWMSPVVASEKTPDIHGIYLSAALYDFATAGNASEFMRRFGSKWTEADRKAVQKALKPIKTWPTYRRDGRLVYLKINGREMKIDFSQIKDRRLVFEGVSIKIHPDQPLRFQMERLMQALSEGRKTAGLVDLVLPRAEAVAFVPVMVAAGTVVGMALANKLIDRYGEAMLDTIDYKICESAIESLGWDWHEATACKKYLESIKIKAAKNPEIIAAKTSVPEPKPNETPIETALETCPQDMNGADKGKVYAGTFFLIKEERRVRVKADFEGKKIAKVEVRDFDTGQVIAVYKLTADNELSTIDLMQTPKKEAASITPASISLPAAEKLADPEMTAQQTLHRRIFSHFGLRMSVCKAMKEADDAIEARKAKANEEAHAPDPAAGRR